MLYILLFFLWCSSLLGDLLQPLLSNSTPFMFLRFRNRIFPIYKYVLFAWSGTEKVQMLVCHFWSGQDRHRSSCRHGDKRGEKKSLMSLYKPWAVELDSAVIGSDYNSNRVSLAKINQEHCHGKWEIALKCHCLLWVEHWKTEQRL